MLILLPLKGVLKEKFDGNSFCLKHLNKYFTFSNFIFSVFFLILMALFRYYVGDIFLYLTLSAYTCLDPIINIIKNVYDILKNHYLYENYNYAGHQGNKESNTNINNVFYSSRPSGNTSENVSGSGSGNASGTASGSSGESGEIPRRTPGNIMKIQNIINNPTQTQPEQSQTSIAQPNNNVAPNIDLSANWAIHNKSGEGFTVRNGVISIVKIPQNMSDLFNEEGKIKHNMENKNIINGFTNALEYHAKFFEYKARLRLPNFDQQSQR